MTVSGKLYFCKRPAKLGLRPQARCTPMPVKLSLMRGSGHLRIFGGMNILSPEATLLNKAINLHILFTSILKVLNKPVLRVSRAESLLATFAQTNAIIGAPNGPKRN